MPTTAAISPISEYTTLLTHARIDALHALADILATSSDPTEKRLAAAAILRAPNPESAPARIRSLHESSPPAPCADPTAPEPSAPNPVAHPTRHLSSDSLANTLEAARRTLAAAGIPIDDPLDDLDPLDEFDLSDSLDPFTAPNSPAAHLAANAGQAPPS